MTFTSPSTSGPFWRLMTAALLPTSGNTFKNTGNSLISKSTNESLWPNEVWVRLTLQFSCLAHTHWNTSSFFTIIFTLRSLPSPLPTPGNEHIQQMLTLSQSQISRMFECPAGLQGFTCYRVYADALDVEGFGWRQLPVEPRFHDLVVLHVPALRTTQVQN